MVQVQFLIFGFANLVAQETYDMPGDRFIELQQDVPNESVTDDHIALSLHDVSAFNVPNEIDAILTEKRLVCLNRQDTSLAGLLADIEQSHPWICIAHRVTGVHAPEMSKLHEMVGFAPDVGTGIHQKTEFSCGW